MTEKINHKSKLRRRRYDTYPPETDESSPIQPSISPTPIKTPVINYSIPTLEKCQKSSPSFKSVSASVLADEIRRNLRLILIDCRYPFEYFGGHIKGAINIYTVEALEKHFYDSNGDIISTVEGLLPIFYCEFSQMRGPTMACALRQIDISHHQNDVSNLDFHEIYLLDRGYNAFWSDESLRDLCEPSAYVSMHSLPYRHVLRQYDQHRRSRSVSVFAVTRSKRNQNRIFSELQLVVQNTTTNRHPKTPRTRLCFE